MQYVGRFGSKQDDRPRTISSQAYVRPTACLPACLPACTQNVFKKSVCETIHPSTFNPLNAELNLIRHLLALLWARHIVHVSRIRVNTLPFSPPRPVALRLLSLFFLSLFSTLRLFLFFLFFSRLYFPFIQISLFLCLSPSPTPCLHILSRFPSQRLDDLKPAGVSEHKLLFSSRPSDLC